MTVFLFSYQLAFSGYKCYKSTAKAPRQLKYGGLPFSEHISHDASTLSLFIGGDILYPLNLGFVRNLLQLVLHSFIFLFCISSVIDHALYVCVTA